jgi:hypothetical protein
MVAVVETETATETTISQVIGTTDTVIAIADIMGAAAAVVAVETTISLVVDMGAMVVRVPSSCVPSRWRQHLVSQYSRRFRRGIIMRVAAVVAQQEEHLTDMLVSSRRRSKR